jgi:hypothetical protein
MTAKAGHAALALTCQDNITVSSSSRPPASTGCQSAWLPAVFAHRQSRQTHAACVYDGAAAWQVPERLLSVS